MKIIFAGGGTAGHVNPAIAAADFIKAREDSHIWLSGGSGNIEERLAARAGYDIFTFPLKGLKRSISPKGLLQNASAIRSTMSAVSGCKRIIDDLQPDIVVGTGGYASFPMVYAAAKMGVKTAILEVNAIPGVATKQLAPLVDCVMLAYAEAEPRLSKPKRVIHTGLPVRDRIFQSRGTRYEPFFVGKRPMVTCFWGSVGASNMNKYMLDFIEKCSKSREFNLLYASGDSYISNMREQLSLRGVDTENCENVKLEGYIYEMDRALALSDIVICRAGGTIAELCAAAKPSILVPSPWVAEDHQSGNAAVLESAGAALVVREGESAANEIYAAVTDLLQNPKKLREMSDSAWKLAQPQALEKIYAVLKEIASSAHNTGAT